MEESKNERTKTIKEMSEKAAEFEEKINKMSKKAVEFEEKVQDRIDDAITHSEKKMAKEEKKNKKRLKPWQIVLIVIGAIIVAMGIGVGVFLLIGKLTAKPYQEIQVQFESSRPDFAVTFTAEEQAKIDAALAPGASDDEIKEAIAAIYARANYNKINADQALTVLRGQGSASVGINLFGKMVQPEGSMISRGFKVQSGDAYYQQKAAKVVECSIDGATALVSAALNQQERGYASGDGVYKTLQVKGSDAKVGSEVAVVPYLNVSLPKAKYIKSCESEEKFMENGYFLDDYREICNFRITKNTIVLKELEAGKSYISYDESKKCYTLRFSLLIEGEGHDECVQVNRQYLRDSSNSNNLEFGKYDLIMEVWDNGYIKSAHDDEVWAGEVDLGGSKSTTSSDNWYEMLFYYTFDESLFSEEDAQKFQGEDWAQKVIDEYAQGLK